METKHKENIEILKGGNAELTESKHYKEIYNDILTDVSGIVERAKHRLKELESH